jgi:RNA polymerase sigma factor (sigma-70 family)
MDGAGHDQLVERVRGGDRDAYRLLVEDIEPRVRAFIAMRAVSATQVDEVVQAAFVAAYLNLHRYEAGGTFASWVTGFARNLLRESHAERARRAKVGGLDGVEGLLARQAMIQAAGDDLDDHRLDRLRTCLERLSPNARAIAEARFFDDVSIDVIAERFHRTRTAIAVALTRLKAGLRRCVEGGGSPE